MHHRHGLRFVVFAAMMIGPGCGVRVIVGAPRTTARPVAKIVDTQNWVEYFADDFSRSELGADWKPVLGEWSIENGTLKGILSGEVRGPVRLFAADVALQGRPIPESFEVTFDCWTEDELGSEIKLLNAEGTRGIIASLYRDATSRRECQVRRRHGANGHITIRVRVGRKSLSVHAEGSPPNQVGSPARGSDGVCRWHSGTVGGGRRPPREPGAELSSRRHVRAEGLHRFLRQLCDPDSSRVTRREEVRGQGLQMASRDWGTVGPLFAAGIHVALARRRGECHPGNVRVPEGNMRHLLAGLTAALWVALAIRQSGTCHAASSRSALRIAASATQISLQIVQGHFASRWTSATSTSDARCLSVTEAKL